MTVPDDVRIKIRESVHAEADRIGWAQLNQVARSRQYDQWVHDPTIGGILLDYLDSAQRVRPYIKDTLMKAYGARQAVPEPALSLAGMACEDLSYDEKPSGARAPDGRIACWGPAKNWKVLVMSCFERAVQGSGTPHAVILTQATARYATASQRRVIEEAADRLGIQRLFWVRE